MNDSEMLLAQVLRRVQQLEQLTERLVLPEVGNAAAGFSWSGSGITTAQTVLPAGTVTRVVTVLYAAAEETGADTGGGTATLTPGDSFNIVVDGTNTCALACTASGAVTIARTAGADSYAARLFLEWI